MRSPHEVIATKTFTNDAESLGILRDSPRDQLLGRMTGVQHSLQDILDTYPLAEAMHSVLMELDRGRKERA